MIPRDMGTDVIKESRIIILLTFQQGYSIKRDLNIFDVNNLLFKRIFYLNGSNNHDLSYHCIENSLDLIYFPLAFILLFTYSIFILY